MARKGTQKVKTGCTTCKIRKVKCDEEHPSCKRCVSTGRKCDGYVPPPIGTYTWPQLLLPVSPPPAQAMSAPEQRAMSFFRELVAPVLAGPLNGYFWTDIVAQVSHQEMAAKHAVLAISSLYEAFCEDPNRGPDQNQKNPFAIWHYNEAVKHLQTTKDQGTIVLVCALFVCVEFLRGDYESAVNHCRHGINMLNQTRTKSEFMRDYMFPAFSRLSIFPYFFGVTPDTFPCLEAPPTTVKAPFRNTADAHSELNPLLVRTVRFVRSADAYRLGVTPFDEPDETILQERQAIESALDSWFISFYLYKSHTKSDPRDGNTLQLVEMQWFICKIWIDTCWVLKETAYDEHMDKFRSIVDLATEAAAIVDRSPRGHDKANFTFEMGFGPLLAFVVIKCRRLNLRIAAMRLMKNLSLPRESSWDRAEILSLGQRTIEIEHDLELNMGLHDVIDDGIIPPEEKRIKDSIIKFESDAQPAKNGDEDRRRKVYFLVKNPEGDGIAVKDEWFTIGRT